MLNPTALTPQSKQHILKQIFCNKMVLGALALTLFFLIIFHIGSIITLPGIKIKGDLGTNTFASMLNLLAGGGLSRLSLFSIGVGPYITAQIIVQLLSSDLIPPLTRMAKSGDRGKRQLEVITRIITIPFCIAQSYAVVALILQNSGENITIFNKTSLSELTFGELTSIITVFCAGTFIALFFGDMITKRGIGNGVTLLILSGIVASVFSNFNVAYETIVSKFDQSKMTEFITTILSVGVYFAFFFILLLLVVFIDKSIRKIPVQQVGSGLITNVNQLPFLPIKLNAAGVIPVIFASSLMTIPETVLQFLPTSSEAAWFIRDYLLIETPLGLVLYMVFITLFSFFYSYIQLHPEQLAENFEKSGKFIPGIKSGEETARYLIRILNRINCIGAPYLTIIAALPYFVSYWTNIPTGMALGGTGLIIMATATLEMWNSTVSNATTTGYNVHRQKIESKLSRQLAEEGGEVKTSEPTQMW